MDCSFACDDLRMQPIAHSADGWRRSPQNEKELSAGSCFGEFLGEIQNDPEIVQLTRRTMTPPRCKRTATAPGTVLVGPSLQLHPLARLLDAPHSACHASSPAQEEVYATSTMSSGRSCCRTALDRAEHINAAPRPITGAARRITLDRG